MVPGSTPSQLIQKIQSLPDQNQDNQTDLNGAHFSKIRKENTSIAVLTKFDKSR